jgi:hypothetical protein
MKNTRILSKKKKNASKVKENDVIKNKSFIGVIQNMINTSPIRDKDLIKWNKENKSL